MLMSKTPTAISLIVMIGFVLALAGLVTYHAMHQAEVNFAREQQIQEMKFKTDAIVGWVKRNELTKQLYYEEACKP